MCGPQGSSTSCGVTPRPRPSIATAAPGGSVLTLSLQLARTGGALGAGTRSGCLTGTRAADGGGGTFEGAWRALETSAAERTGSAVAVRTELAGAGGVGS